MLIRGDARFLPLRDGCVDCVVTSPPYWGLRDYGNPPGVWGGDVTHRHDFCGRGRGRGRDSGSGLEGPPRRYEYGDVDLGQSCECGAWLGCLGLEPTPDDYIDDLADVFDDVRRVLKPQGVCWVNLGDSYQSAKGQAGGIDPKQAARRHGLRPNDVSIPGLKPKDLVGIPWMFAFAARRRGWFLRSDVIWSKPNPMPESVLDRPTKSHEYLFLMSKSREYWYDAAAIREPYALSTLTQFEKAYEGEATKDYAAAGVQNPSAIKRRITDKQRGHGRRHAGFNDR